MDLLAAVGGSLNQFADTFFVGLSKATDVIYHPYVLYIILAAGLLFTLWSLGSQYWALAHGTAVIRGKYDQEGGEGAISHFQALSAALSATVGLGNITGVSVAVASGGPGAVFWMWVVGIFGMALKTAEVTLSMLFRDTTDPENPHGGPMWVAKRGFQKYLPKFAPVGTVLGGIFCLTLLCSTATGGNMFQAWSVGEITSTTLNNPNSKLISGIVLALIVGMVIIGGIKRIGKIAGILVPIMCLIYFVSAVVVIAIKIDTIPSLLLMIVEKAFSPTEASGAFLGGTFGSAIAFGMKRALFSSEAGQGSSPIAHSAAKTNEPVREGVVAGLEPFVDTLVVCTMTALVILCSGVWNREPETVLPSEPVFELVQVEGEDQQADPDGETKRSWTAVAPVELPEREVPWQVGSDKLFIVIKTTSLDDQGQIQQSRAWLYGNVKMVDVDQAQDDQPTTRAIVESWGEVESIDTPTIARDDGPPRAFVNYLGPSLTAFAIDQILPGYGTVLILIAAWLFAVSTMISWSYYGEQGVIYLFGQWSVLPYKVIYCLLAVLACTDVITKIEQINNLADFGTGVMLWVNIPLTIAFGGIAMGAYHRYVKRLRAGEFEPKAKPEGESDRS